MIDFNKLDIDIIKQYVNNSQIKIKTTNGKRIQEILDKPMGNLKIQEN